MPSVRSIFSLGRRSGHEDQLTEMLVWLIEAVPPVGEAIVRRRDERSCGEHRSKRLILEIYDELAEAIATGRPYQTRLDPPPADPRAAHPPRTREHVGP